MRSGQLRGQSALSAVEAATVDWFIDTDNNEESFFVRHACTGTLARHDRIFAPFK